MSKNASRILLSFHETPNVAFMDPATVLPPKYKIWWLAARPKTLWAAVTPVIMAGAIALSDRVFHPWSFFAALCGGLLIQIGTNFANDLFDFKKEVDTRERLGPPRATQAGWVTPRQMSHATIIVFALALLVGIYLVHRGGLPLAIIGLLSVLCGVLYTAGPFPLGYIGLGEIFVLIFFGPVPLCGTYYVMAKHLTAPVLFAGLAPGLLSVAILVVNNLRDIDTDKTSGKRTLAVRFGRRFAMAEYGISVALGLLYPLAHYLCFRSHQLVMLSAMLMPASIPLIRTVITSRDGNVLNGSLAATGRLLFLYGLCFSIGWLL